MSSLKYRSEIDGLRAIAVIAVIIYHINPALIKGGFLGVDVFFVISGFLITAIIQKGIDEKTFTLRAFWMRRIRRLYPALMTMVALVTILGNFILIRPERGDLIKQSLAAIFSFSNIFLWKTTSGYWSSSSENISLLHTWSLSLEEQFYIILPVFLIVVHKILPKALFGSLLIITICSLGLSILYTDIDRSASFYLLPTRMWELSLGSLLAFANIRKISILEFSGKCGAWLTNIGLLSIILSFFIFENNENFPKAIPLLACIGTIFILAAGKHQSTTKSILTIRPVRYIGNISYSLYLWHWPLIVFSAYTSPDTNYFLLLPLMFTIASLSYHFIECPFRKGFKGSFLALGAMATTVALATVAIWSSPVSPGVPEGLISLETDNSLSKSEEFEGTQTILSSQGGIKIPSNLKSPPKIILTGSSHARVLATSFAKFANENNIDVEILTTSAVGFTYNEPSLLRQNADIINEKRLQYIETARPNITIIAGLWSGEKTYKNFETFFRKNLTRMSNCSKTVIVLSQVPMHDLPTKYEKSFRKYLLAKYRSSKDTKTHSDIEVEEANESIKKIIKDLNLTNVQYLDIFSPLTNPDESIKLFIDNEITYSDRHHLNNTGADYTFKTTIEPTINQIIATGI